MLVDEAEQRAAECRAADEDEQVYTGLGVAIFARSLLPGDLVELPASAGLPDVGAIDLTLLTNPRSATEPAEALTAAILASGHAVKSRQD